MKDYLRVFGTLLACMVLVAVVVGATVGLGALLFTLVHPIIAGFISVLFGLAIMAYAIWDAER